MVYVKRCKPDRHCFEFSHVTFIKMKRKFLCQLRICCCGLYFSFSYTVWVESWSFYTTKVCRGNLSFTWELHPEAFRKKGLGTLPATVVVGAWGCLFLGACHSHPCLVHTPGDFIFSFLLRSWHKLNVFQLHGWQVLCLHPDVVQQMIF